MKDVVAKLLPEAERFLCELIRFESTPGREHEAMLFAEKEFRKIGGVAVERVMMSEAIKKDPDYSTPVEGIKYDGRFNLRVIRKGTGGGKKLLMNAHMDVVPASEGHVDAFNPQVRDGVVFGRGACDDKGQVATAYLLFKMLEAAGVKTAGDIVAHIVNEEENGGNGSLAMARTGEIADGCVVLESSDGKLYTSIRGAVWFKIIFHGKAGHSGQAGQTKSALLMARDAIAILEKYHAELLKASRGNPLFDPYPNPMPITFGKLVAGNWPASAPSRAQMEGVLGLLPNTTKEQVMDGMKRALSADASLAGNFELTFMYRHDSSVVDPKHELPQAVLAAAKRSGVALEVSAMTASCDAWFYNNQLKIPTVVYGPGTLKVAHSKDEQIAMKEIQTAVEVLGAFVVDFCGVAK
ncbi:MAG: M20/M25/M40 family metallo-hydrolase [Phycisphaerales bacterium]|nr:M20/M25/M40 family metallo-hydrolase [Phycisphaerales bacterium]